MKELFAQWQADRKQAKLPASQDWCAGEMGFGQSAINQYLNGKIPLNPEAASKFAALLGVDVSVFSPSLADEIRKLSASALVAREGLPVYGNAEIIESPPADRTIRINQFDTGGKMGHGLVLQDQPGVIRSWTVSPDWVQKNVHRITSPKNLAIVTGFGDSMKGVFNPGDPLLIDTGVTRADIDGIYFFRVGEEGFVKRLQRIPTIDGVILRAKSANTDYDPFDIVKGMDFEIFGRVVKAWESEDF
ncbi:LexA family transcriptional regulator [Variovorax atrisoli]|uniref:LexA family transcriptional regulator n=1 Tax=Variovorax atrisoli TaxID=3394203 RepID=UPI00037B444E|nr:XRE family transcriptional regulator [Variovorax paradoxus]